ncbi:MAG TPA: VapC toxin family PIN domain ribonuclease [Sphingobium sp.]|uniref:type II toxin-antitoxin system VapC family toxin n=1 Tax=unclassified Sphingobium TaxID=2611147 RepID=UPI000EEBE658|nr:MULTISPECIES: type II toxin-antitoxin system VapC family toxin [unclassified Sphingobium]WIW88740.1 type II toxin-antitoxin system VapC family toxin [Sphingobium sp. V4]HAF41596.1 VapC toxin family PIN domain ribonuclease [Sphingobium sp.]
MIHLLDTNSCIYIFTGAYPSLIDRLADQPAGSVFISSITYAELAYGTVGGKPPSPDALAAFVEEIAVLPFDEAAARAYAAIPFRRGSFDRLIAAQALALGASLVSRNLSDFTDIAGLKVEDWTR